MTALGFVTMTDDTMQRPDDFDDLDDVAAEAEDDEILRKTEETRVGARLSDLTTRRVIVGVLALLRSKTATDRYVMVASTHLFWDPKYADVKLAQARRVLGEVELFLESNSLGSSVPVIVAGDYNSTPGSEVHSTMLRGFGGKQLRSCLLYTSPSPRD